MESKISRPARSEECESNHGLDMHASWNYSHAVPCRAEAMHVEIVYKLLPAQQVLELGQARLIIRA